MRVAALYDVHGNVHALEAVLTEAAGADVVLFGGDLVAGAFPVETLEVARALPNARFVRGNADELDRAAAPEWAAEGPWLEQRLGAEARRFLAELPFSFVADDVLYVHANPWDVTGVVVETTAEERLARYAEGLEQSAVVIGHVHMQFRRVVAALEWVCAGSVGSPYEDAPGAYWLDVVDGAAAFRRTEYDPDAYRRAAAATDYPLRDYLTESPSRAEALAAFEA